MKEKMEQGILRDCQQINRECLWEYHMNSAEILEMAQSGSDQERFFLFTKIIENSTNLLKDLNIFSIADQKKMLLCYTPPNFNHQFLDKRHKIVKYFLTGQKVHIPELRWNL